MGRPKKPRTKEHYYQAAKKHGYRARSAYKIRQMIDKYDLLKGVNKIVELCSNPGGWTQVLREYDKGLQIIAVDLERMSPIEDVKIIQGDITDQKVIEQVEEAIDGKADLVLSDCSPKVSGQWELDVARQLFLAEKTIEIALSLLGPKGKVVTKLFQGVGFQQFLQDVRAKFRSVRLIKPPASRQTSAEIYLLAASPK